MLKPIKTILFCMLLGLTPFAVADTAANQAEPKALKQNDPERIKRESLITAAEQGNPNEQYQLAILLRKEENIADAVTWYKKAAEQGHVKAQHSLGIIYSRGHEKVKQDYPQALYWYSKAAKQGYVHAQNNLGRFYFEGKGTEVDDTKAKYWFQKAADQNNEFAQNNLALIYAREENYEEMHKWLAKSAQQNSPGAFYLFGKAYELGWGVLRSHSVAFTWYEKSAKAGYYNGALRIAFAYQKGELGKVADAQQAEIWFKRADRLKSE